VSRVWIADPLASDGAQIVERDEKPGGPAQNLLTPQPTETWTVVPGPDREARVVFDLGAATPVRLAFLGYTNATATTQWRIRASDLVDGFDATSFWADGSTWGDASTWAGGFNSGFVDVWPTTGLGTWDRVHGFLKIDPIQTFRFWELTIQVAPGEEDSVFTAGRLYLGDPWEPPINMTPGASIGFNDASLVRRTPFGRLHTGTRGQWRRMVFVLQNSDEDLLFTETARLDRLRGTSRDVLVVKDIDRPSLLMEQSVYGVFGELDPVVIPEPANVFVRRFQIQEWERP